MKPTVALFFLLACSGVLLGDSPRPGAVTRKSSTLLEDLVQMTRAGSSDETVLAYARAHRLELPSEVSDNDLRWLRDSGVSERVVRYMTAIDVRASGDEPARQNVASDAYEGAAHPRSGYSYPDSDYDSYSESYPDTYADRSYPDVYYDSYPFDYDFYPYGYGFDPYPFFFFVDRGGFFGRFHGRDHRFGGHRGFDGRRGFSGRGGVVGHAGSRDAWRERGFDGRRGSARVVGPRGSGRPGFARGFAAGPQGPRRGAIGRRGFGPPGSARGNFPHGFRGPRGGGSGHSGFSHPGFSGPRMGGGFSRGPRMATGSLGGRGRR